MGLLRQNPHGARTRIWTRGAQTIVAFVNAAKKRRRTLIIGMVVALLVVAVSGYSGMRYVRAQAATRVVEGYSALYACLLGSPMETGERGSVRYRKMQLSTLTQADVQRAPAKGQPWPDRCATFAHQLHEGLEASALGDTEAGAKLASAATALATDLGKADGYFLDISQSIDDTFDGAMAAGIRLVASSVPPPPEMAETLSVDSLTSKSALTDKPLPLAAVSVEPVVSSDVRLLISHESVEPSWCSLRHDGASCTKVADAVREAGGDKLLATAAAGATPLIFAGDRGSAGIFHRGKAVLKREMKKDTRALGGHATADGLLHVLTATNDRIKLLQVEDDRVRSTRFSLPFGMKIADPERDVAVLFDQIVVLGETKDGTTLASAQVKRRGLERLTKIGSFGTLPTSVPAALSALPPLDGCQTSRATTVRATKSGLSLLSFWIGDRWTKPVKAMTGGHLACHAIEARITRVDEAVRDAKLSAMIRQDLCKPTGCESQSISLGDVLKGEGGLAPQSLLAAGALAGKLLFVWHAGQRGGVRMKLAALGQMSEAPDVIVFDDLMNDGAVSGSSTLLDMRLVTAERFAVLLLSTTKGMHAIRITPDGTAKAMLITHS